MEGGVFDDEERRTKNEEREVQRRLRVLQNAERTGLVNAKTTQKSAQPDTTFSS